MRMSRAVFVSRHFTASVSCCPPLHQWLLRVEISVMYIGSPRWVIEGRGSRVRFEKDGEVETFHRPHPAKEAKRYQVRAARAFLERMGITP